MIPGMLRTGTHSIEKIGRLTQGAIVEIDDPIDLGGIGKGYAVDVIADAITRFITSTPHSPAILSMLAETL